MRRVLLTLLLSSGSVAVTPPGAPATSETVSPTVLRLPHPQGDAFLLRPAACVPTCPLVVVSHSQGMSAEVSLGRPHLRSLFDHLTGAGYAVLLSDDAGPATWGAPQVLTYLADIHARATQAFAFSGRTYTLGYSMGGLPALLSAYRGAYPVSGVVLLDAQVSLQDVWQGSNARFRTEVGAAHGLQPGASLSPGADPLQDFTGPETQQLPLLVAGSAEDQAVSFARNGEALFGRNTSPESRLLRLSGPHLGGAHFGEVFVQSVLTFLGRLEDAAAAAAAAAVTPDPAP